MRAAFDAGIRSRLHLDPHDPEGGSLDGALLLAERQALGDPIALPDPPLSA